LILAAGTSEGAFTVQLIVLAPSFRHPQGSVISTWPS